MRNAASKQAGRSTPEEVSRLKVAVLKARAERVRLERERRGRGLESAAECAAHAERMAGEVERVLIAVPDRLAPLLVGLVEPVEIDRALEDFFRDVMTAWSEGRDPLTGKAMENDAT